MVDERGTNFAPPQRLLSMIAHLSLHSGWDLLLGNLVKSSASTNPRPDSLTPDSQMIVRRLSLSELKHTCDRHVPSSALFCPRTERGRIRRLVRNRLVESYPVCRVVANS